MIDQPEKFWLEPFPGQQHPDIRVGVEVRLMGPEALRLWYVVEGDLPSISVPGGSEPRRESKLWEHTCFELFIRPRNEARYFELNFSPSLAWAAYEFDGHRAGMRDLAIPEEPAISTASIGEMWALGVDVDLGCFEITGGFDVNLTTVIEDLGGVRSYWALAHPQGEPDFHHPDCFVLQLPPPAAP